MIKISPNIISFSEIPEIVNSSEKSVLLVRHSYRESLINGNHDPALTEAGWNYAVECGKFLNGIKNISFGSSIRKRAVETVQALSKGAGFDCSDIEDCPLIRDTAMFTAPENLGEAIENNRVPALLKEYFSTGNAPGMIGIKEFSANLLNFLTEHRFSTNNTLLAAHDIIIAALLIPLKVYPFVQEDWCGYIQGAFLWYRDQEWNIAYAVPDKENRVPCKLFV